MYPASLGASSQTLAGVLNIRRYLWLTGAHSDLALLVPAEPEAAREALKGDNAILYAPLDAALRILPSLSAACQPTTEHGFAICAANGTTTCVGSDEPATFHGAMALIEMTGVRFGLEGPIVPARGAARALPESLTLQQDPVFSIRGLRESS